MGPLNNVLNELKASGFRHEYRILNRQKDRLVSLDEDTRHITAKVIIEWCQSEALLGLEITSCEIEEWETLVLALEAWARKYLT